MTFSAPEIRSIIREFVHLWGKELGLRTPMFASATSPASQYWSNDENRKQDTINSLLALPAGFQRAERTAASSAAGQRQPRHKHVWCQYCKKVMVMRIGAGGCHCGRIFGVYEVVRTPESTEDDDLACKQTDDKRVSVGKA